MTVQELASALSLTECDLPDPDRPVTGGYAGDLLSWVMGRAREGDCWITIMSNQNVAAVAVLAEVGCVLLAEGVQPDEALRTRAAENGVNLLGSERSTFALAADVAHLLGQERDAPPEVPPLTGGRRSG